MQSIQVEPHPLLDVVAFETTFPRRLGDVPSPPALVAGLALEPAQRLASSDDLRGKIRDLLRHGGYKPTGRGKPASEYLIRAATDGALSSINAAVDACNVVSLHAGLPISVVDLDRARPPFAIRVAPEGTEYVFNASGQTIDVKGLLCLFDADGACANAVKDSQRTKTTPDTTRTLSIVWGHAGIRDNTATRAFDWYKELLEGLGATVSRVDAR
jgi:DNA/RNA-binding domain of Phe-tRNA-synthetase-like protein